MSRLLIAAAVILGVQELPVGGDALAVELLRLLGVTISAVFAYLGARRAGQVRDEQRRRRRRVRRPDREQLVIVDEPDEQDGRRS